MLVNGRKSVDNSLFVEPKWLPVSPKSVYLLGEVWLADSDKLFVNQTVELVNELHVTAVAMTYSTTSLWQWHTPEHFCGNNKLHTTAVAMVNSTTPL